MAGRDRTLIRIALKVSVASWSATAFWIVDRYRFHLATTIRCNKTLEDNRVNCISQNDNIKGDWSGDVIHMPPLKLLPKRVFLM